MTDQTIVTIVGAILGAIPPTIMAFAALRQGQKNEVTNLITSAKVDGHLSALAGSLNVANEKIQGMNVTMAKMEEAKSETKALNIATALPPIAGRDTVKTEEIKAAVVEAVVESVPAPVKEATKEAVQESFTRAELEAFLKALKK